MSGYFFFKYINVVIKQHTTFMKLLYSKNRLLLQSATAVNKRPPPLHYTQKYILQNTKSTSNYVFFLFISNNTYNTWFFIINFFFVRF